MGILDKLFGGGKKKPSRDTVQTRGKHMPDLKLPIDEKFTIHFKKNGGKFLYCDTFEEASAALKDIVTENHWEAMPFFCMNANLEGRFKGEGVRFTARAGESDVFFTTCEHLVAQDGSILVSSHQLLEKKLHEIPENVIVFATTSQLVESIGEGLKAIKKQYRDRIPTNITTLKHFEPTDENAQDFLTYGSSSKHLYLILLEDL